ncbi:MAG: polysaccharide export protein [Candidatus Marinimicrobia bacterium]|nr:polysaccharide export protein [Candidatus Neomarinimicrobiota bacterium]
MKRLTQINFLLLILIATGVLLSACSGTRTSSTELFSSSEAGSLIIERKSQDYVIQSGDEITLSVWGYEEFETNTQVNSRGTITIPLVGELKASGLTKQTFKDTVKSKLANYIKGEIQCTVTITSPDDNIVSVLGSVGRPDNYQLMNSVNLFEILSKAGGTTEQADLRNIRIYRNSGTGETVEVDLAKYFEQQEMRNPLPQVRPGDVVYVPRQENFIRDLSGFLRDVVLLFSIFRVV